MRETTLLHNMKVCVVTALVLLTSRAHAFSVQLSHVSTVYLPHSSGAGSSGAPQYAFDTDAVEKAAFDPDGKIIYAAGEKALHVINASDPKNLTLLDTVYYVNEEATNVVLCGGAVFVSYINLNNPLQGGIYQYRLYDPQQRRTQYVRSISMGSQPDHLLPTKSCTLVVALENPPVEVNGQTQDPPGGVGIIRFPNGVDSEPATRTLDFTAFNSRFEELSRAGVRWVYRQDNLFSDDLEPEYVTFNANETKAYIAMQENNAIAVVDLETNTITDIYGLGFKNWTQFKLDPSDEDNGIKMASWEVYGIYQPDGMTWFSWEGQDYVITANEGSSKNVRDFEEDKRGRSFTDSEYAASVSSEMRGALETDSKLGRLHLSTVDGKDQNGKFERFYTYGARSFSIWRASDMVQVFDSGSELGEKMAEQRPDLFNNRVDDGDSTVASGADKRSDDRGMEPESVAVTTLGGRLVVFVGLERPGGIAIYSLAPGKGMTPQLEGLYTGGIPTGNLTWAQLYQDRRLHAVDPESITVIGKDSGLADYPMLMVTGTVSGTVSFLKVEVSDTTGSATTAGPDICSLLWCLLTMTVLTWRN